MTTFKNCNAFLCSSMLQTCPLVAKYFGHLRSINKSISSCVLL